MEQINVNLIPGRALPVCHVSQYDDGRQIRCNLFEGDQVFALATGDTAEIHVRKPDTTVVTEALTVVNAQTYLDIVTTQQMDAVAGSNLCEIQIVRSGNTLGTINFIMEVEPDPMDEGIASASEIRDLQAQVASAVSVELDNFIKQFGYNCWQVLDTRSYGTHTSSGHITFAFSSTENSCSVSGTATSNTFYNLYFSHTELPANVKPGSKCYLKFAGVNVWMTVYIYDENDTAVQIVKTKNDLIFTVPNNAVGFVIRLHVDKNSVVSETVSYKFLTAKTNEQLGTETDALIEDTQRLDYNVEDFNAVNVIDTSELGTYTTGGNITFAFDTDGETCAVSGTASSNTFYNLFLNHTAFPENIEPGGTYFLKFSGTNVWFYVYYYDSNDTSVLLASTKTNATIKIPSDAVGLVLRLYVSNGSVVNETIKYQLLTAKSNKQLSAETEQLLPVIMSGNTVDNNMDRKISDNSTKLTRLSGYDLNDVLSAGTWEQGNITASGAETANTNYIRSDYLETDDGDAFFTKYESSSPAYEMRFFYYDENKNFIGYLTGHTAFSGDVDDQTYATCGKGFVRFVIFKTPADTTPVDTSIIALVDFTLKRLSFKNAEIIRMATNNVRNWGTEHNYGYVGDYESNALFYKQEYANIQPTVLGLQEFSPYLDADHDHPAAALFRNLFVKLYHSTSPRTPVLSNLPLAGFQSGKLSSGRAYATGTFETEGGKTIRLFNFHAYPGATQEAIDTRATEFAEIIALLSGQSFIITGDMNVQTTAELASFVSAGCHLSNGGDFGTFGTCISQGVYYPFDNVITSADLKIINVNVAESFGTSDHRLLYSDIMV